MTIRVVLKAAGVALALAASAVCDADPQVLLADLAFNARCDGLEARVVEERTETFLKREGFDVLNLARIQREHGIHLFAVRLVAIDANRRMIEFLSLPSGTYALRLNTEPPTRRHSELEERLLSFPTSNLRCSVSQVSRSENPEDARALFESEVVRVKKLFESARDADRGSRT